MRYFGVVEIVRTLGTSNSHDGGYRREMMTVHHVVRFMWRECEQEEKYCRGDAGASFYSLYIVLG